MRMKKRYLFYFALASVFATFYWYSPLWGKYLLLPNWDWLNYFFWLIPATGVALYEVHVSQCVRQSAIVTALFWFTTILIYYMCYLIAVFAGEDYFTFYDVVVFATAAIVPKIIQWGVVAILGGILIGGSLSWCYLLAWRR